MAPSPSTRASLKVTKSFTFDDHAQAWSNRWHFAGKTGLSNSEWTTLADAVTAAEKVCYDNTCSIVSCTGYEPGSEVPVFTKAYSLAGTGSFDSTDVKVPGDCAGVVKFTTDQRTTKNHPIYLFKYFHDAKYESANKDALSNQFKAYLEDYTTKWIDGTFTAGGSALHYCGPYGAVAQSRIVGTFVTHRDFRK